MPAYIPGPAESETESTRRSTGAKVYETSSSWFTAFMALNPALPPFDDVHTRSGLAHLIDPPALFPFSGIEQVSILLQGFPPPFDEGAITGLPADIESAKTELRKSEYHGRLDEFALTLRTDGAGLVNSDLVAIFDAWREHANFYVQLEEAETFEQFGELQSVVGAPMRVFEIEPLYPDPSAILGVLPGAFNWSVILGVRTDYSSY